MKLRDSFNSGARNLGNGIYDGLGDKLTSEINPKDIARKGLLGILAVGTVLPLSGCLSTYGRSVARDLACTGMQQAVVSEVRNSVEGPRGTTVNVGGDESPQHWCSLKVWKYKDFDNNCKFDGQTEILGPVNDGDTVNLDKVGIAMYISSTWSNERSYSVVDSNYNRLAVIRGPPAEEIMYASDNLASNPFMEVLNNLDAGNYTIYASLGNAYKFSKKITIVRDPSTKSTTDTSK